MSRWDVVGVATRSHGDVGRALSRCVVILFATGRIFSGRDVQGSPQIDGNAGPRDAARGPAHVGDPRWLHCVPTWIGPLPMTPDASRITALIDFRAPEPDAAPLHAAFAAPRE